MPPLPVRSLPRASFSRTVTVDVDVPFATIEVGEAVTVDAVSEATPGTKVTVAVCVTVIASVSSVAR